MESDLFCHFVNHFMNKNGRAAIFNTKMSDGGSFIFLNCIDLKWQEMHYKVIFVNPKWSPATLFGKTVICRSDE